MKSRFSFVFVVLVAAGLSAHGQGTFVYDQQSSDESSVAGDASIQGDQPGQSFTPTLSSVGFIRLFLQDGRPGVAGGATVYISLRSTSISGTILGSTDPVTMPDSFVGFTNFFFSTAIPLIPGTTYFFQPVVQSGDFWHVAAYNSYNYPGGMEFTGTTPFPNNDLWFREGVVVVPEPLSASLVVFGTGAFALTARLRRKTSHERKPAV